jgi:4-hydroxy-tetrahydrodipicolinate synthase
LFLHFKAIADSVDIPCILYNIKGRTGVNIETETVKALTEACRNIVGVKEASGSLDQMRSVIEATHGKFHVLSGDDNLSIPLIELGGDGVISVASNMCPAYISTMIHHALAGRMEEAKSMEANLSGFFKACFLETNPIPIKTAMARYGWCEESFRLPMCTLENEDNRTKLYAELDKLETVGAITRR